MLRSQDDKQDHLIICLMDTAFKKDLRFKTT